MRNLPKNAGNRRVDIYFKCVLANFEENTANRSYGLIIYISHNYDV